MRLAITGASGFVGQALVKQALAAGHTLLLIGRKRLSDWADTESIEFYPLDLEKSLIPASLLEKCDILIHLAASLQASKSEQVALTKKATQNVFDSVKSANLNRVVLISSISLIDFSHISAGSEVTEQSPVCSENSTIGVYALAKLSQEIIAKSWAQEQHHTLLILRPGLIYEPHNISDAHAGFVKKGFGLLTSHSGEVPLISLANTVAAILDLAQSNFQSEQVVHLLDSTLPQQKTYLSLLKKQGTLKLGITLPWKMYLFLAKVLYSCLSIIGMSRLTPDSLLPSSAHARMKPFRFKRTYVNKIVANSSASSK